MSPNVRCGRSLPADRLQQCQPFDSRFPAPFARAASAVPPLEPATVGEAARILRPRVVAPPPLERPLPPLGKHDRRYSHALVRQLLRGELSAQSPLRTARLALTDSRQFPDALGLFGPRDPKFDVRHYSSTDHSNLLGLDFGGARGREQRRSQRHRVGFATGGSDTSSDAGEFLPALSPSSDSYPSPPSDDLLSLHPTPFCALNLGAPRSPHAQSSASTVASTSHRPYDFVLPDIPHHSTWTLPTDEPCAPTSPDKRSLFLVALPSIDLPATPALTPAPTYLHTVIDLERTLLASETLRGRSGSDVNTSPLPVPSPCDQSPRPERSAFAPLGNRERLPPSPHSDQLEKLSRPKSRSSARRSVPPSPALGLFDLKSTKVRPSFLSQVLHRQTLIPFPACCRSKSPLRASRSARRFGASGSTSTSPTRRCTKQLP